MRGRLAAFAIGRAAGRNDVDSQQPQQSTSSNDSQMDDLENLVSLHEKGALTDEEFKAAKKKLLGK